MSHGFVDDIPGHAEFWRRFRCADYHNSWWRRQRLRFRLLCRLFEWKRNISKLRKANPHLSLKELENFLIYLEVNNILKGF